MSINIGLWERGLLCAYLTAQNMLRFMFPASYPFFSPCPCQRVDPLPFTAEEVTKEDILIPQTYFGWSSEDVDMQVNFRIRFS